MRRYSYNYRFLAEYALKHNITQKELAAVLQTNADGITRWTDGIYPKDKNNKPDKTQPRRVIPVPTDKLLLFCNHYDVDLSEFFTESDHAAELSPKIVNNEASTIVLHPDSNQAAKILQLELQHQKEINKMINEQRDKESQMMKDCRAHEDQIRKECDARIEEYRKMMEALQETHTEGNKLIKKALDIRDNEGKNSMKRNVSHGGDIVSDSGEYENYPLGPTTLR